ncbi:MAG: aspartyl/asparaginyl beta-hydroxylase domain-containing protein [Lysobacteraceae bacterium]
MNQPQAPIPLAFRLLQRFERYLARHSPLGDPAVYDCKYFDWLPALEARWQEIAAEYRQLLASAEPIPPFHEISPEQRPITSDALWRTFVLFAYGKAAERNCALCPRTTQILGRIPGMKTAMFSILEPGKQLPWHRGPYKGLLRVHLALEVPSEREQCWLEVDNLRLHWLEGQALVFDDTFQHRAANLATTRRCVLFLDVLRPLEPRAAWINRTLIALLRRSPFGARAWNVFRGWYRRNGIEFDA